jgi:AcrR family transcriptional regulator
MEEKKTDRRISRTRRLLRTALLELILEKGYDAVTVEDITGRADLGRTTFYLHYKDKEDILFENINEMIADLTAHIAQIPLPAWKMSEIISANDTTTPPPILLVFQHAAEHADLYRIILRGTGSPDAVTRLHANIVSSVNRFMEVKAAHGNKHLTMSVPMEYFANYFASSLLGVVTWWLENGLPYSPEEMAGMFQKMFFMGAFHVLGTTQPQDPI